MKYLVIPLLLILSIYPLSFAGYNWRKKNKFGAFGMLLLVLAQIVLPGVLLLTR